MKLIFSLLTMLVLLSSCNNDRKLSDHEIIESRSANQDVTNYLESFKGLGALTDSTLPTPALEALSNFQVANDLQLDLVLSEPEVVQPIEMSFDHRGRLWVVQYQQYPYPQGLKITHVDNFLRVQFDKVPLPPPNGIKGADRITIFEDTNGDGKYDKTIESISGLNIATSVTTGRGKIWVLNPPYLLAYPDHNDDGIPDGPPVVHLEGFGLEDTHAVANSLRWGPDGWIYGAQGSTTTANITSAVSKNVSFQGQVIWRYSPESKIFEVFAEGGGNSFNVEFDDKGRLYSGNNNYDRGPNFKQGGYYPRSLGKHGPYTNRYTFGNLPNMELKGERRRFTHALVKYEGGKLPDRFRDKMIAINPLLNYIQLTRFEKNGSSFKNIDEELILETDDHWFRPVNIKTGPDGAIYIADWYDSRLSHVDPRDTWDKGSGRIYRLRAKNDLSKLAKFDLSKYSNQELVSLLTHQNKWFRQETLKQIADRRDKSFIPKLVPLLQSKNEQTALEALWAINLSGGFTDDIARLALSHKNAYVRLWGIRLLGDLRTVSSSIGKKLSELAATEVDPEVRSQLASSSKRLPAATAVPIITNLLINHDDSGDPDIPLLIWWAIESKAGTDRELILSIFKDKRIWQNRTTQLFILERVVKRYAMEGGDANYSAIGKLIKLAPSEKDALSLVGSLQEGLRGQELHDLPSELSKLIEPFQSELFGGPLVIALRQGDNAAVDKALGIIMDDSQDIGIRLTYINIFGEGNHAKSVPVLLKIIENNKSSDALKQLAISALQCYDLEEIGSRIIKAYPQFRADAGIRNSAIDLVSTRYAWALQFLEEIDRYKRINKNDVPDHYARRLKLLENPKISKIVDRLWPHIVPLTASEKHQRIAKYSKLIKAKKGNEKNGHLLFAEYCGSCHRLFDDGGIAAPDLTGYDRNNVNNFLSNVVDPNADVREGYVIQRFVTTDGRILEGRIVAQNGDVLTLQPLAGKNFNLHEKQIKEMRAIAISSMPERILDKLNDSEIQDIFSYIMKKD